MKLKYITVTTVILMALNSAVAQQSKLAEIEQSLKNDIPNLVCVDARFATAGQPGSEGFAKLAQKGFRSVLNLRTESEGVDINAQRDLAQKAGLRYIHIPVPGNAPKPEQADEFIKAVKDKNNQPMLIHCGSANRVGGFFMIYRVLEQGWTQEKALEEATRIGLRSPVIKQFALDYIAARKRAG